MVRKLLLLCGVLSSLLYVATDIIAATRWDDYSYASQAVSELSAIGAPSRPFVVAAMVIYNMLMVAFGVGVFGSEGRKRTLRFTGALLISLGIIGFAAPFTPMHLRGAETTLTDTMHIVLTSACVFLILLTIGFGASTFGRTFRMYSIATILLLLVSGTVAGMQGPRVAANLPTPWLGITERINIFGFMLWVVVLAIGLLRAKETRAPDRLTKKGDSDWIKSGGPTGGPKVGIPAG